jgi:MFS family permease
VVFSRFSQTPIAILIAIEFTIIAIGFFGMGWAPSVGVMMIFCFINQFGCGLTLPTMLTWVMRQLNFEQRGRGAGIFSGYQNGGQFVGPQLLTYLAVVYTAGAIKPAFSLVGWGALLVVIGAIIAIALGKGTQRVVYDVPEGELAKAETLATH